MIVTMNNLLLIILPALIAFLCACWIHPYVLKVAKVKNIVDKPNARKLQHVPIPILGGLTVVFGILSGIMSFQLFGEYADFFPVFASVFIILIIGLLDDMISLSPKVRFIIEIVLVLYLILTTGFQINDFHGLWGIDIISKYVSLPLTIFACVGIINAINLIDGVDGYSSGYTMVSCMLFGIMFYNLGNIQMVALAAIVAASLAPFFLHNVFGKTSKMFIGDSGTLSLGVIFSVFVISIISADSTSMSAKENLGIIPFTLAVLCVPVFDTLRVMTVRIVRGKSPFSPDKTHLHHLFIELGYSHIGTALSIIGMNLFVVLCWYCAYLTGLSIDVQLYIVILIGVFITFIFYPTMKWQIKKETLLYHCFCKIGASTHVTRKGFWLFAQKWADKSVIEE